MEIEGTLLNQKFPFKFNSYWLDREDFCSFINDFWLNLSCEESFNPMDRLVAKLKLPMDAVTKGLNLKKSKEWEECTNLEEHISSILMKNTYFMVSQDDLLLTKELERKQDLILK